MLFKKLELVGFKSFFDKTILHFEPGITAVVGPNGCGKSNIFDGIRWVLGEQSVKSLRGSQMQDVIFNGTDSKEALSMAEVSLTFDNSTKFFNVDNDEVMVTRRIFRSGESEYLLNKNIVRLKDILDILLGTGIGAESYSLVAQGKIDLILSSRPEDRRLVFDEASGITKYKSQKREAQRKLEEMDQNLLRVNDIIIEVKRQIGSLERQASKARRYKEVFEELKSKELNLAVLQKKALLQQKQGFIDELNALHGQEEQLLVSIKEQEALISNRQQELKAAEEAIMAIKNEIMQLDNLQIRTSEHINFNKEKILQLEATKKYICNQAEQLKNKLVLDEGKLNNLKSEFQQLHQHVQQKTESLKNNEQELHVITLAVKTSLDNIAHQKKLILELAGQLSHAKNEITDIVSKQQIFLARQRRLELEKAKVGEEMAINEGQLNSMTQELESLKSTHEQLNLAISAKKQALDQDNFSLETLNNQIIQFEKELLTIGSHKDFIEKLATAYQDIHESMNATIYLDRPIAEQLTGLVIKVRAIEEAGVKLSGEAKPIDLDTQKIMDKILNVQATLETLISERQARENRIQELKSEIAALEQTARNQEIELAHKRTHHQTLGEQFNKIKEELEVINVELSDVLSELQLLSEKISVLKSNLADLENKQRLAEDTIAGEQHSISTDNELKEGILVVIAQTKTELHSLNNRLNSYESDLKVLMDVCQEDELAMQQLEIQLKENEAKKESLNKEILEGESEILDMAELLEEHKEALKNSETNYRLVCDGQADVFKKIEADRIQMDVFKNKLYDLQMRDKDADFKILSIKDRILQLYKIDLESALDFAGELDEGRLGEEVERLKEKLDSYGMVNLVAIQEYDELKQRYDFLVQQQTDLTQAKDSLHEAILKINRTTRKMFLETFEQVRLEFRNYFRLLFNGGDAQVFLVDEQDPLESGIEIICRPPGKKLQNVLLLSGGEKALSAIALIFAIFKVKPSPFCILDEIDAALDEANVDRFGRVLQEFAKHSQFIVITHNKRTIASASVMYGITMEESGVSKIVSVKFSQSKLVVDKEVPVPEPV